MKKEQKPYKLYEEDLISRSEALKLFTWTNTKEDIWYGLKQLPRVVIPSTEPMTKKVIKMRNATPEERASIAKYIKSISKPTGVSFETPEQEPLEVEAAKLQQAYNKGFEDCRQSAVLLASDLKQDLPDDEHIADMVMAHNEGILEYQTQLSLLQPVTPQPEIVRCSQCKYAEVADSEDSQDGYTCQFHRGSIWFSGSYCSWAERRQDG